MKKKKQILSMLCFLLLLFSSCRERPIIRGAVVRDGESSVESAVPASPEPDKSPSQGGELPGTGKSLLENPGMKKELLKEDIEQMRNASPVPFTREGLISKDEGPLSLKTLRSGYGIQWDDTEKIFELAKPWFDEMNIPEMTGDTSADRKTTEKTASMLHYLISMKYRYAENPLEGGYLIFRDDREDPLTGEKLMTGGTTRIVIIIDASLTNGKPQTPEQNLSSVIAATEALSYSLPKDTEVALRVTGNLNSSVDKDKRSSESLIPLSPPDTVRMVSALAGIKGGSNASAIGSIKDAAEEIKKSGDSSGNSIICYVTDGADEVSGDPDGEMKKLKSYLGNIRLSVVGFNVTREDELKLLSFTTGAGGTYAGAREGYEIYSTLSSMLLNVNDSVQWRNLDKKMMSELELQYDSYKYDMKFPYTSERLMLGTLISLLREKGYIGESAKSALSSYFQDYYKTASKLEEEMFLDLDLKRAYLMDSYTPRMGKPAILIKRRSAGTGQ